MNTKHPYSVHSFMLPIRWDYLPVGFVKYRDKKEVPFDVRTDLKKFNEKMLSTAWKRKFYKIENSPTHYNEFVYFQSYTTRTIFDLQRQDEVDERSISANKVMVYYELDAHPEDQYIIECVKGIYSLRLTGISLHVYNTGVAIITYNLENYLYASSDDVLAINEFGRRVYAPFLVYKKDVFGRSSNFTDAAKKSCLAQKITIMCHALRQYNFTIEETFSNVDTLEYIETHHYDGEEFKFTTIVNFPEFVSKLFSSSFVFKTEDEDNDKIKFNFLKDDRMFFQCWYGNNSLASSLAKECLPGKYEYMRSNFWSAMIHGDAKETSLGLANDQLKAQLNIDATYARWAKYGTLFGFTRDSFVCISSDLPTLINNGVPDLRLHMKSMYYQMAVISLAQRSSMLRFSAEVAGLSDLGRTDEFKAADSIKKLYLNYIEFINKIYFREITYQMQGREIYEKFQGVMNIEKDVDSLDKELEELNQFSLMVSQDRIARESHRLNQLATLFIPASLAFSILGANFLSTESHNWIPFSGLDRQVMSWILIGFIPSLIFGIVLFIKKNRL